MTPQDVHHSLMSHLLPDTSTQHNSCHLLLPHFSVLTVSALHCSAWGADVAPTYPSMERGAEQSTAAHSQFHRMRLCIPKSSNRKWWWVLGRDRDALPVLQKPSKGLSHFLLSVSSQAKDWTKPFSFAFTQEWVPAAECWLKIQPCACNVSAPEKSVSQLSMCCCGVPSWAMTTRDHPEVLWFKSHTQSSWANMAEVQEHPRVWDSFISLLGTPQRYRSWLLWPLSLGHGSVLAEWEGKKKGQKGIFFLSDNIFVYEQLVNFPWAIPEHPSNSSNLCQVSCRTRNHNGASEGYRSPMQQANTTNFPKSQPQHCRQKEKRASWHCSTSSLLPRTSQFFMQPKQRDSRNSIIKLRSFRRTNSCPGTAAVQHVLLLELEAPRALDAAERGWNHCQCWMESHPWQCFQAGSWEQLMLLQWLDCSEAGKS